MTIMDLFLSQTSTMTAEKLENQTLEDCLMIARSLESQSPDLASLISQLRLQVRLSFLIRNHSLTSECRALEMLDYQTYLTRRLKRIRDQQGGR